jgi:hypothetical protein
MLWFLAIPFAIAIVGNVIHSYSWHLADKRHFKYDYEKCISTWGDDSGNHQSYKYVDDSDKPDQSDLQ